MSHSTITLANRKEYAVGSGQRSLAKMGGVDNALVSELAFSDFARRGTSMAWVTF